MSDLNLDNEERELIEDLARDWRLGPAPRLGSYATVLFPILALGGYGVFRKDFLAVAMALAGLLIFVVWLLSFQFTKRRVHQSLFQKILIHEKSATEAQPGTPEKD